MGDIILYIGSSLDGFIARKSGAVDFLFTDQDYGYSEFYKKTDIVVMGSKTYRQALSFGEFQGSFKEIKLKFIGAKSYSSGLVELRYKK